VDSVQRVVPLVLALAPALALALNAAGSWGR
jgi:hypothetical protein